MEVMKSILCILILSLTVACNRDSNSTTNALKNFRLKNLTNNKPYELENFKGKPLILNFWASWCAPCKEEMPFFESLWKEYKNRELILVGINVMDKKKEALNTLQKLNISYINLFDTNGEVSTSYSILALPVTYFINRKGEIHYIKYGPFLGKSDENIFKNKLEEIL